MKNLFVRKIYIILTVIILLLSSVTTVFAITMEDNTKNINLTEEEKAYIKENQVVHVAMGNGIAPMEYYDADGKPAGIAVEVTNMISRKTGLKFQYVKTDSWEQAVQMGKDKEIDLIDGMPEQYRAVWFNDYVASEVYLTSKALLYINKNINTDSLDTKIYAAVKNATLPEGIDEKYAKYYNSREDCIDAVESGEADYGYGNEFSITYYIAENYLKNVLTIPVQKETREVRMIYINEDPIFQSIMNKAMASIDESEIQSAILLAMTHVDYNITLSKILEMYRVQIFGIFAIVVLIMVIGIICLVKINIDINQLSKRFLSLSDISDEFLYKYDRKHNQVQLLDRCVELFCNIKETQKYNAEIESKTLNLKNTKIPVNIIQALTNSEETVELVLHFEDNDSQTFRIVKSIIKDKYDKTAKFIIGKLVNITPEKELIQKAQIDGATGIYNSMHCKEEIRNALEHFSKKNVGALMIMDIDNFKSVNDTYGHNVGDQAIIAVVDAIKNSAEKNDIIGRVGGDEFYLFMKEGVTEEIVEKRVQKINTHLKEICKNTMEMELTISIGVAMVKGNMNFDELYEKADAALYKVKRNKKNGYCIADDRNIN